MKKLAFSLLFFSAIAWLWIGHMMGADGVLQNSSGTTVLAGSSITGTVLTNSSTLGWTNSSTSSGALEVTLVALRALTDRLNIGGSGGNIQLKTNGNLIISANIDIGTYLSLPTNYVAANFTPASGKVTIVASNGILYKVTQLSTNLLSALTP